MNTQKQIIYSVLIILIILVSGCTGRVATKTDPVYSKPTATETILSTNTPEPTKTPTKTPEPSPTPEAYYGDPSDVETWPEKYKDYFVNHPEDQSMDADFQMFMDAIRAKYLKGKMYKSETMDTADLMWITIEENAKDKKETILTLTEIVNIELDEGVKIRPRDKEGDNYYIWRSIIQNTNNVVESNWNALFNSEFKTSIYGREIVVPRYTYDKAKGDFVGMVELPGSSKGQAILLQIKDAGGGRHLIITKFTENNEQISPSDKRCINASYWTGEAPRLCLFSEIKPMSLFLFGSDKNTDPRKYRSSEEIIEKWLEWPPFMVIIHGYSSLGYGKNGSISTNGLLDLESGLEMADNINIAPKEYDINNNK